MRHLATRRPVTAAVPGFSAHPARTARAIATALSHWTSSRAGGPINQHQRAADAFRSRARERADPRVDRRVLVNNRAERFIGSPWCGEHQHHEAVHAVLGAPEITESVGLRVEQFHYGVVLVRWVVELEQASLALAPRRWRFHPRVGEGYPCPPDGGGRVERFALEQHHPANECVVRVITTGRMEARSYTLYAHHLDVTCTERRLFVVAPGACIDVRFAGRFRCTGAPSAYRGG